PSWTFSSPKFGVYASGFYLAPAGGLPTVGGPAGVRVTVAPLATMPVVAGAMVMFRPLTAVMAAPAAMPVAAIGRPTAKPVAEVTGITVWPDATSAVVVVVTLGTRLVSVLSSAVLTL